MGALTALQRSPGALVRNPVVMIPVLIVGLIQVPQLLLQSVNPLIASFVSIGISGLFILVVPFFVGGMVGMADEALDGRTGLGTFVMDGKAHYVTLLVAYLLLLVVNLAIAAVLLVAALVGSFVVLQRIELSGIALGFAGLFFLLLAAAFLLFIFFIQFYGQAIVLDGERAVGGIKRSVGLVRQHLLSTFGYTIIAGLVGGLLGLAYGGLSILISPQSAQLAGFPRLSLPTVAGISLAVVVFATVIGSVLTIYSVAFYREISA